MVFEHEFLIGVQVTLGPTVAAGDLVVPARLRYQACNDKMCFSPATAESAWTHPRRAGRNGRAAIDAAETPPSRPSRSARGEKPAAAAAPGTSGPAPGAGAARRRAVPPTASSGEAQLDRFTVPRHDRRLPRHRRFPRRSSATPRPGVERARAVRGPRPARHPAHRAPRRPRAEPHAVRAADDPDQPRHHRRRRAGRLARAAASCSARPTAPRWRSSTACSASSSMLTAGTFGTINASPWFNLGIAVLFVVLAPRDVRRHGDRLLALSAAASARREPRHVRARVHDGRGRGAARRRVRRAGRHPGGALLEQPLRGGHDASRWRCRSSSASAWRCRGPSPAPASPSLPKPGMWMVRVKQAFGVLILAHGRLLRLPGLRALRQPLGRSGRGAGERRGEAEGRLAHVAGRGPGRGRARAEAGAHRLVGHLVQELPDDGQDDAGGRRVRRRSRAT